MRKFNSAWELTYLVEFSEDDGLVKCVVPSCLKKMKQIKLYSVEKHYNSMHASKYKYITGDDRKELLKALKVYSEKDEQVKKSGNSLVSDMCNKNEICDMRKLSYEITFKICQKKLSFTMGPFVKNCFASLMNTIKIEEKYKEKLNKIRLSRQTVMRRFNDINFYLVSKLKEICRKARWVSICLDESTDVVGMSQLSFFVRATDENLTTNEEFLSIKPLEEHTRGIDIFNAFLAVVNEFEIQNKISLIAMDGCYTNFGQKDGFVGNLRKGGFNCPTIHCMLHKLSLANKSLGFESIMSICTTTANKIRGGKRSMRRRMFRKFLLEHKAPYNELFLYCEVRWLSRGKFLERFWQLLPFTIKFIKTLITEAQEKCSQKNNKRKRSVNAKPPKTKTPDELLINEFTGILLELEKTDFKMELSFAADFFKFINLYNTKMQGKDLCVADLIGIYDSFCGNFSNSFFKFL